MSPIECDNESVSLLGNPEWLEQSPYDDDYKSDEENELSPIDDDYVREEYR